MLTSIFIFYSRVLNISNLIFFRPLSMNLRWIDLMAVKDYLNKVSTLGQPPLKYMEVFYGLLEDPKTGIQRVCTSRFVEKAACEMATFAKSEPGKKETVLIRSERIPVPRGEELLTDVYHYLLLFRFDALTVKNCFGCVNDRPSQREHMELGCLDDRDILVIHYGKECHEKIVAAFLLNAYRVMADVFKVTDDQSIETAKDFLKSVKYNELLLTDRIFVYEFEKLLDV